MVNFSSHILTLVLLSGKVLAHGPHSHSHDIEEMISHHSHSETTLSDFFNFLSKKTQHNSVFTKVYGLIDEHYLISAITYNFAICLSLATVFYFVPVKTLISKFGTFLKRSYNQFLNKYGYLRDFESDDPTINSTSLNFVGLVMSDFKKNIIDNFDFENLFNFFMLAGFMKELFLELFYNVFVYSIGLTSKHKAEANKNYSISNLFTFLNQNKSDGELVLQNVSSLAQKIMFSYLIFYLLDRFINIFLIKFLKLDPEQVHTHSHSHTGEQHDISNYLDELNEKLAHKNDIKSVDIELDIDGSGRVLRSYSTTTFDNGSIPQNEEYTDSEDEDYVADENEAEVANEEEDDDDEEEDSEFEIDDFEIEKDVDKQLTNLSNLKFVILSIINDFILNINSGISLYSLFAKQRLGDLKIFMVVWAIQYSSHVFADCIYMLNKTTPAQFSLQLILSNLGVVVGILFKHLARKQVPIIHETSKAYAENNLKNYLIKIFDINDSYSHSTSYQLENAIVKSEYWIVETFYHYLNTLILDNGSFDFEILLLTSQIGFTMFLIFNKILPETKAPTSIKQLLVIGSVAYLGYKAKA
ncbi:hypothetical protein HANVADRAFT_1331 [Hanseniaspora valbyensis NRRL Y-1626]|uniref:Abscisic acid G-protein coupled receptor-like domain-containing protein n=1 Tax=Hanseniaspora valbyensis NRRL Y-1626 TaxID=766949 RepID=A0A1B7TGH8_9ASCO|nr:hypothetical protein HANVADRAFT_1331 [Hanseniaspora valbyensis NRRL Y-1626]